MLNALEIIRESSVALEARFAHKLSINSRLNRQLVSFQANKNKPGYRWFKYKEGFSEALVQHLLDYLGIENGKIFDPFAGVGTTLFAASERGLDAAGIEVLPIGCEIMEVRRLALGKEADSLQLIIDRWRSTCPWESQTSPAPFPHLRITNGAFPTQTQNKLDQYRAALASESESAARLLRFAAICVLEEISYTRKDGQYLRWDYRSGRRQGVKPFDKGPIYSFDLAIRKKLDEIYVDLNSTKADLNLFSYSDHKGAVEIMQGSCLNLLPGIPSASIDALITSPPYCNRYDYTRTYALELAALGVNEDTIRQLRQAMLSCTVENRDKPYLQQLFSQATYERAVAVFDAQQELQMILDYLERQKQDKMINNTGIPRMVKNYFFEMALVIFECARILKPDAPFVMVNDNVRYGGATIPVDLILSDFAEQAGLAVETIWVLPTGKGNSSQQMGLHGREEVRKCIYIWRRSK